MEWVNLQINRGLHQLRNIVSRYKLKNKDVTIISSNCIGGVMYHDLKLRFSSPTINLFFYPEDFLKYVCDLKFYNSREVVEITGNLSYPVGKVEDVEIHFLHYNSFAEARECWEKRKKRINYENIVVIMTDQGIDSKEFFDEFDNIPYPKILLTNKHMGYSWSKYISGFDSHKWLGNTIEYKGRGRRYYEQFDYVELLNSVLIKKNKGRINK